MDKRILLFGAAFTMLAGVLSGNHAYTAAGIVMMWIGLSIRGT